MKSGFHLVGMLFVVLGQAALLYSQSFPGGSASMAQPDNSKLKGEIHSSRLFASPLMVQLERREGGMPKVAQVNFDGSFEWIGRPGVYHLRVTTVAGEVLYEETVSVPNAQEIFSVNLPDRIDTNASKQASVSIQQLQHKVPSEAQKDYDKGVQAGKKNKPQQAVVYLQQAISVDPQFADAHFVLALEYVQVGQLPEASTEFSSAVDLVPDNALALDDLCIVQAQLQRWPDAEKTARRALALDPGVPMIHLVLGISLVAEKGQPAEELDQFRQAAAAIPRAHLLAADLLEQIDQRSEAAKELEEYLRVSPSDDAERPEVNSWLSQLEN